MNEAIAVAGRKFEWSLFESSEFPLLLSPYPSPDTAEILRIAEVGGSFDIALRVVRNATSKERYIVLGPILVLGAEFPSSGSAVPCGWRIRIRPRVSVIFGSEVGPVSVERIVSWSLSRHFRAVQCDRHGIPLQREA